MHKDIKNGTILALSQESIINHGNAPSVLVHNVVLIYALFSTGTGAALSHGPPAAFYS